MDNRIVELDSKSELEETLRHLKTPKVFVENTREKPNHFILIESDQLTIGLATCHRGIKIQVGLVGAVDSVIIGHDKELICCSQVGQNISWRFELDFCFYEFKIFEKIETIVVIDEISVIAVNFLGKKIWCRSSPDVIKSFNISISEIIIKTMDDRELTFDTKTGADL
jgi:hypothetical protein